MTLQWWCSAQGTRWTWAWRPYPGIWLVVLAIALTYYSVTKNAPTKTRRGTTLGWLGVLGIWLALDWPLGPLAAGYLASAHALEFLIITMIAAPLLLIGVRSAGLSQIPTRGPSAKLLAIVTQPVFAAVVFNVVTAFTHVPFVVDTLMVSQWGSFAIDIAWLLSALCFWWPVVIPVPSRPYFTPLVQILYLFLGTLFHSIIAIIMLMVEFPLYGIYELAPPMTGLSALQDLQVAGGIMELIGAAIMFSIITWIFFRFVARES